MSTMIPYGNFSKLVAVDLTLSPAQVAINTTVEQTFACPGVKLSVDTVIHVRKPTTQAGLGIVGSRVTADDTVAITFINCTGVAITPTASESYRFTIGRLDGFQGNFS